MEAHVSRRQFMELSTATVVASVAGCGTILHPERRYQPSSNNLDWGIVALDTLGLLLFFIPGVIAFAVDFTTGAIYLPAEGYGDNGKPMAEAELVAVQVPSDELSKARVEQVASEHAGQDVRLVKGEYETAPLAKLTEFWPTRERLAALWG